MPGNLKTFNELMKQAHNAAWDQQWADAVAFYRRALAEFPEDTNAHAGLANALEQNSQHDEALHEYRLVAKVLPNDPTPLLRMGALQEKLNHRDQAATLYMQLGDLFVKLKQPGRAVKAWQRAGALEPDRTDVHVKLAEEYQAAHHFPQAAKELVTLARILMRRGENDKALEYADQASIYDPSNPLVTKLRDELVSVQEKNPNAAFSGNPLGQAQRQALARLAETVLEDRSQRTDWRGAEALLVRAINAQSQKRTAEAIDLYNKVLEAGIRRVEVLFSLGLLYQESLQPDKAIPLLEQSKTDAQYALASHLALGQAYRAKGNQDAAINHLLEAMKLVDVAGAPREQADEISSLYQSLSAVYAQKTDPVQAERLANRLIDFFGKQGWRDKVGDLRRHIAETNTQGMANSLNELMDVPASEQVLECLRLSADWSRRGLHNAAVAEAMEAIALAPDYMPGHVQLAEAMWHASLHDQAISKYETLIRIATIRNDKNKAQSYYQRLQKLAENDPEARQRYGKLMAQL